MELGANLNHSQTERLALLLGVKRGSLESLKKIYSDDPQMFAFRTLLRWRDRCELSVEQQRQFLDSSIKSVIMSNSSTISNSQNGFHSQCKYSVYQQKLQNFLGLLCYGTDNYS